MPKPIIIVQGAQYGSEAKGAIAAYLCETRNIKYAVRTGAINAGHTVYYKGKAYKMQQLPTGWVNPNTQLVIGPGAMIHMETLMREIMEIDFAMDNSDETSVMHRLWIDYRAGLHSDEHQKRATKANRHHAIGATGKGCSEAIVDKIRRRGDPDYGLFKDTLTGEVGFGRCLEDVPMMLYNAYQREEGILLEGTQGSHLDLHLGPYPFTTHKPCNAAQWVVEAGLPPGLEYEVILVARTYPIRVAGNSGPMPKEIGWADLARTMNARLESLGQPPIVDEDTLRRFERACWDVAQYRGAPSPNLWLWTDEQRQEHKEAASELHRDALEMLSPEVLAKLGRLFEYTTVTKKLRRIAEFDIETLWQSVVWNAPTSIALTFANYWYPELWNLTADEAATDVQMGSLDDLDVRISTIESELNVPVSLVSFGPQSKHILPAAARPTGVAQ